MKLAILIFADTRSQEDIGRVSNAFLIAEEAIAKKEEVFIAFQGAGSRWIGELQNPEHLLYKQYLEVKSVIRGACLECATAFKVADQVTAAGYELIDDYRGHTSVYTMMVDGYTILTF